MPPAPRPGARSSRPHPRARPFGFNLDAGEPLIKRKDDNADTLKARLAAFHAQTKPVRAPGVLEWQSGEGVTNRGARGWRHAVRQTKHPSAKPPPPALSPFGSLSNSPRCPDRLIDFHQHIAHRPPPTPHQLCHPHSPPHQAPFPPIPLLPPQLIDFYKDRVACLEAAKPAVRGLARTAAAAAGGEGGGVGKQRPRPRSRAAHAAAG